MQWFKIRKFSSSASTYHKSPILFGKYLCCIKLSVSINLNLSISQPYFVFQISQPPNMAQKWFCIQHSQMDLSFQERKTVCNSVAWFTSYNNFHDTGEFRRFSETPCSVNSLFNVRLKWCTMKSWSTQQVRIGV